MRQRMEQPGAWSTGNVAAYSVIEWEDTTGESDIWEYDGDHHLLRHFTWEPQPDQKRAVLTEYAPDGREVSRSAPREDGSDE